MPALFRRNVKIIATDAVGAFLIIISPITGLVPGPGGIPIFMAGLGLLSINHQWARDLMNYIKTTGKAIFRSFITKNPLLLWLYDIISGILLAVAAFLMWKYTHNVIQTAAIFIFIIGLSIFFSNRQRLKHIARYFRS